ncbi:OLC1v1013423C1 [Oldenlandia corymbosa var. corymbosa]|uniref:OLC1v1013423C1 n=1 Tax=Oldenlandia corymbosa var. corymbosa TaxID=529605 RepID=A0AAV1DY79_OLDCO|nr:OLC1v1013423C1 [Oldenlandia corymbosa var. corymbosa]
MGLEAEAEVNFSGGCDANGELFRADEHPLELRQSSEVACSDIEATTRTAGNTTTGNQKRNHDEDGEDDAMEADEEEEDGEGEEEGDGEDDDFENGGGYRFRFSGDMDPLSFTEQDSSGLRPYEQFERLEHQYQEQHQDDHTLGMLSVPDPPPSHHMLQAEALARAQARCREISAKKPRLDDVSGATMEEIMEVMNLGTRRRSKKHKKRGRRKGAGNKSNPEVTRKLGDATLHYALGRYEEAIGVLYEVIRVSPNLPDPYHRLGLIYSEMGDKKRAMDFYMIAAHLTPKDASLWKLLVSWSMEQGDRGQAKYCLSKALTADPEDINLQFHRASLYVELGDYLRAADSYEQISRLCPDNVEAVKTAAQLYKKCGQRERAVNMLENFLSTCPGEADPNVIDLLGLLYMDAKTHLKALELIEKFGYSKNKMPLYLATKAGICSIYLGNMEKANAFFSLLLSDNIYEQRHLIFEVGDALLNHEHYECALEYYLRLVGVTGKNNGHLHFKIAECYRYLKNHSQSIKYYYKALDELENNVDARLALSTLLLEEKKDDEAISVLSPPPKESVSESQSNSSRYNASKPWWLDGKIKLKLSQIYKSKGLTEAFVDVIFPVVRETMFIETIQRKFRPRKRLPKSVLSERIKVLGDERTDSVFQGFRPVALPSDLLRASRAKKVLKKKETLREAKRAAALAAGIEWMSDDSEDDLPRQPPQEPPIPNLLKDVEHQSLLIDLCKGLSSLRRYWEALEVINLTLKLASNFLSTEKKEEFRALGALVAYNIADPAHGFAAWNCYYKVISKLDDKFAKHSKFLRSMRTKHKDCVPVMLIFGHQFTTISQHQTAAREYLEAYKRMPDVPLINLCAGTALINLALGHRLQNKHQCVAQGLAFLYNNLRLCKNSQEALYNIARAYHHVGLVTLAAANYEKVLAMHENDYPIPTLPNDNPDKRINPKSGYCDLRREAAYNLHLIYKKSGAIDLARQDLFENFHPYSFVEAINPPSRKNDRLRSPLPPAKAHVQKRVFAKGLLTPPVAVDALEPKGKGKGGAKAKTGAQKGKKTTVVAGGKTKPNSTKGAPTSTHRGESIVAKRAMFEIGGSKGKKKLRTTSSSTQPDSVKKAPPSVVALLARLEQTKAVAHVKVDVATSSPDIPLGEAAQKQIECQVCVPHIEEYQTAYGLQEKNKMLSEQLVEQAAQLEAEIKKTMAEEAELKTQLGKVQAKRQGLETNLGAIIMDTDVVLGGYMRMTDIVNKLHPKNQDT